MTKYGDCNPFVFQSNSNLKKKKDTYCAPPTRSNQFDMTSLKVSFIISTFYTSQNVTIILKKLKLHWTFNTTKLYRNWCIILVKISWSLAEYDIYEFCNRIIFFFLKKSSCIFLKNLFGGPFFLLFIYSLMLELMPCLDHIAA